MRPSSASIRKKPKSWNLSSAYFWKHAGRRWSGRVTLGPRAGATGVFAGASRNTYYLHALHRRPDLILTCAGRKGMYGNEKDYLTTRVPTNLDSKARLST